MKEFENLEGCLRVVEEGQLNAQTSMGWRLILVYQDDEYRLPAGMQSYNAKQDDFKLVKVTKFLLRQMPDDAIAELNARISGHYQREEELKKKVDQLGKEKMTLESEKNTLAKSADLLAKSLGDLRASFEGARKLEADLAKVRKAIGERQFKEIVGE